MFENGDDSIFARRPISKLGVKKSCNSQLTAVIRKTNDILFQSNKLSNWQGRIDRGVKGDAIDRGVRGGEIDREVKGGKIDRGMRGSRSN